MVALAGNGFMRMICSTTGQAPGLCLARLLALGVGPALALAAPVRAASAEPEFTIEIRDHRFIPAEVKIPAGVKVRIVLDNRDPVAEEFDSHALNREKHVPPNARVTIFVGPLEPGRYIFEGESDGTRGGPALGVVVAQ